MQISSAHLLPRLYAPTPGPTCFKDVINDVRAFTAVVLDDAAYLMKSFGKGQEKTLKAIGAIISCGVYINNKLSPLADTAKVAWIAATNSTIKSTTELFGAFHIFGSANKLYNDYERSSRNTKISLVFLAVSDFFESLVWLQKVKLVANPIFSCVRPALSQVFSPLANVASKVGGQRLFGPVASFAGKVTIAHIKNYTQVIGVVFGLIDVVKTINDIWTSDTKRTSNWLKVASDVGKLGLIIFSGGLGFWAGYTATFAFTFLWCLPACIFPVARIVYDYHITKDIAAKKAADLAAKAPPVVNTPAVELTKTISVKA